MVVRRLFLAALIAASVPGPANAAHATTPARPPDGTYTYAVSGIPGFTQTTLTIVTKGSIVSTIEVPTVGDMRIIARTDYDIATLLPVEYRVDQNGVSTEVTFASGSAKIATGAMVFNKLPGTTGLMISEGLAAYCVMLPSIAAVAGLPISDLAINGGRVLRIDAAPSRSPAPVPSPASVPLGDESLSLIDSDGARLSFWSNPATHVVDRIDLPGAAITLVGHTDATVPSTPTPAPTPYPTPLPHFFSRDITFASSNDALLAGTLTVPRDTHGRRPAFVFVHGSGAGTRDAAIPANPTFLDLGNALSNAGAVVLRYDKRGIGKSTGTPTEDWRILSDDVRAAVAFLRAQPSVDPNRIFLLGHSEGGLVVPLAASTLPGIAGIVLMAPPAIPMSAIIQQQSPRMTPAMRAAIDRAFVAYAGIDPATVITKVNAPILVLQGDRDMQVLPGDLHHLTNAARAAHRRITVDVLRGDDHLFITVPLSQPADGSEYAIPAPLDSRVSRDIIEWMNGLGDMK